MHKVEPERKHSKYKRFYEEFKKHYLKEYRRAKIYNMWSLLAIVRQLAERITCIKDMTVTNENKLKTWIDKDIELDTIYDKLFIE